MKRTFRQLNGIKIENIELESTGRKGAIAFRSSDRTIWIDEWENEYFVEDGFAKELTYKHQLPGGIGYYEVTYE